MIKFEGWFIFALLTSNYVVGGLEHDFHFSHHIGKIIPTDELIFFRVVETTKQS